MTWRKQSICPWVPREIPGQGSRGVAWPAALWLDPCSCSQHAPPPRSAMVPARPRLPPRQRAWPASGCHGPGVQLRPACPLWNNGEACWGVLGEEMGGTGTGAAEATPEGREEGGGEAVGISWEVLDPQGPRSEISFRCARGRCGTRGFKIQKMGPGPCLLGGQSPLPKGTCPGLGVRTALGGQKGGMVVTPLQSLCCVQFGS